LHHLICSSHANRKKSIGQKEVDFSSPLNCAHTQSPVAYGKRITTPPLYLLVGSLMGETREHHSLSVPPSSVQMFVSFEGAFVQLYSQMSENCPATGFQLQLTLYSSHMQQYAEMQGTDIPTFYSKQCH
jgi:hypothetical protein